jgi:hypothetical protein
MKGHSRFAIDKQQAKRERKQMKKIESNSTENKIKKEVLTMTCSMTARLSISSFSFSRRIRSSSFGSQTTANVTDICPVSQLHERASVGQLIVIMAPT